MKFKIIKSRRNIAKSKNSITYLTWDNWNDYGFCTLFGIFYSDAQEGIHNLGGIKIGYIGQTIEEDRRLSIGDEFDSLGDKFFSLGTDDEYYVELNLLGKKIRDSILNGLNDIAKNPAIFEIAIDEEVTQTSLLRSINIKTVTGQFRRLALGGARLTEYSFEFSPIKISDNYANYNLKFSVKPESSPPTNVHVLIGRNGVGKTFLLNKMIVDLTEDTGETINKWKFSFDDEESELFANLVFVSFSAFDENKPKAEAQGATNRIQYSYIGLRQIQSKSKNKIGTKSTSKLKDEFLKSLNHCKINHKKERWKKGIKMLESDPNFKELEISSLIEVSDDEITDTFVQLSSGHKIVLLTITRIIENIQEKSLILIDEPESHLHPPLLSAFIRALSELLIYSNGVAIIATHSPVVLQEVPKSCVWRLRRHGNVGSSKRLNIETFGENVSTLTHEVFGLEVTDSGFYNLLKNATLENENYEDAIAFFNGELGSEARAILMSFYLNKEN